MSTEKPSSIITPKGRVSYPHLFEARRANKDAEPKYSMTLCFTDNPDVPPGSVSLDDMKRAALACAFERFGDTEATKKAIKSGKIKMPFLKNDEGKYPDEITMLIRLGTGEKYPPGIVDRFRDPATGRPAIITDPAKVYAGMYARAEIRPFAYDTAGNKGVSFALNNVQKLAEGERLDGRSAADRAFDALSEAEDEVTGNDMPGGSKGGDTDPMGLDDLPE